MRVPIPLISKAKIKPSASSLKLRSTPKVESQGQLSMMVAPWKTCLVWVSNKIKLVKLTPIAPRAITPRENCFNHETRVVPSINGNNIIIGSTLVSNVVNRFEPKWILSFKDYRSSRKDPKCSILKAKLITDEKKTSCVAQLVKEVVKPPHRKIELKAVLILLHG